MSVIKLKAGNTLHLAAEHATIMMLLHSLVT